MKTYLGDSVYCEFLKDRGQFRLYLDNGDGEKNEIFLDNQTILGFDAFKKEVIRRIELLRQCAQSKEAGCDTVVYSSPPSFGKQMKNGFIQFYQPDGGWLPKATDCAGWMQAPIDSFVVDL